MNVIAIHKNDVVNSITGFTMSIWFAGCSHYCEDCFNQASWNYNQGTSYTEEELFEEIRTSRHKNISLLGGDPFYCKNREEVVSLLLKVKKELPNKRIYLWTGYTYEQCIEMVGLKTIENIDFLIEGKFEKEKKDLNLKLRGSKNQRVYSNGILREDI